MHLSPVGPGPGAVRRVRARPAGHRGEDPLEIVKLIVGLGNPGSKYADSRHNVGWMVLDRIADRAGRSGRGRQRDASESLQLRYQGADLVLAKPLTFMNDSGIAVRKLMARERVPLAELLVVVDDFALPFGKLRFREGGSHGGHNGLRSIIDELGTEKFSRLRIGIGEPGRGAIDHVLSRFTADEEARLPIVIDAAADAVEAWTRDGTSKAANRFNAFELQAPAEAADGPAPGEVGGPADEDGIRRTKTGWRRILGGGRDEGRGRDGDGGTRR
jgi:PTH1 family peptidyl-tRNA hydrolase